VPPHHDPARRAAAERLAHQLGVDYTDAAILARAGIRDVTDMARWAASDLADVPGVGGARYARLEAGLRAAGVPLPNDLPAARVLPAVGRYPGL
jgi:hypothetical protein